MVEWVNDAQTSYYESHSGILKLLSRMSDVFAFDSAKNHEMKIMRDGLIAKNRCSHPKGSQKMTFPDGRPKGLRLGLTEQGFWPYGRKHLTQCSVKGVSSKQKLRKECLCWEHLRWQALMAKWSDFPSQRVNCKRLLKHWVN